jgi:ATP-dependent DNA helicase RecG
VDKLQQSHRSLPHNPDISQFLYAAKLMVRIGRGTLRMIEACRDAGLPAPAWDLDDDGVTLTLYSRASTESPVAKLTERQLALIQSMQPGQTIRSGEYAERIASEVSPRQAQRDLRELQEADLLRLEGKGRAAHYVRTERRRPE